MRSLLYNALNFLAESILMAAPRNIQTELVNCIKSPLFYRNDEVEESRLKAAYKAFPEVDEKAADENKRTPLMVAAQLEHLFAMQWLLNPPSTFLSINQRKKANVDATNERGETALQLAVAYDDSGAEQVDVLTARKRQCLDLLLKYNPNNKGAAQLAISAGNVYYLKHPSLVFTYLDDYLDLLKTAFNCGVTNVIQVMLSKIENINWLTAQSDENKHYKINKDSRVKIIDCIRKNKVLGFNAYKKISGRSFRTNCYTQHSIIITFTDILDVLPDVELARDLIRETKIDNWKLISAILKLPNNEVLITKLIDAFSYHHMKESKLIDGLNNFRFLKCVIENYHNHVTPGLIIAAIKQDCAREVINYLVEHVDLTEAINKSWSILQAAGCKNNYELVKHLLERGASYIGREKEKNLPEKIQHFLFAHCAVIHESSATAFSHLEKLSPDERQDLLNLFRDKPLKIIFIEQLLARFVAPIVENQRPEGMPAPGEPNVEVEVEAEASPGEIPGLITPGGVSFQSSALIHKMLPSNPDQKCLEQFNQQLSTTLLSALEVESYWADENGKEVAEHLRAYVNAKRVRFFSSASASSSSSSSQAKSAHCPH